MSRGFFFIDICKGMCACVSVWAMCGTRVCGGMRARRLECTDSSRRWSYRTQRQLVRVDRRRQAAAIGRWPGDVTAVCGLPARLADTRHFADDTFVLISKRKRLRGTLAFCAHQTMPTPLSFVGAGVCGVRRFEENFRILPQPFIQLCINY